MFIQTLVSQKYDYFIKDIYAYIDKHVYQKYIPTVFQSFVQVMKLDGNQIELALWDTAGKF